MCLPIFNLIKVVKPLFQYITGNNCKEMYYPNIQNVIRILLTVPVTAASAQEEFFKIKGLKNYLSSILNPQILSALAVLSIDACIASKLDYDRTIKELNKVKSRTFLFH